MPITALPTPPSRNDPANFSDRADAFLGQLPLFASELNTAEAVINLAEQSAVAAQLAAQSAANVSVWVSGTTYSIGDVRFSPTTFLSYRRRTAGAGTTDPASDGTNWQLINGQGNVDLTSPQTLTNKTHGAGSVWNGSAVPIANGGTGAATAAAAFSALKQNASTTDTGVVELATTAEVITGSDTTRVPSVSSLRGGLWVASSILTPGAQATISIPVPSFARQYRVCFNGISLSGTDLLRIQIEDISGTFTWTYLSNSTNHSASATSSSQVSDTSGFQIGNSSSAGDTYRGSVLITCADPVSGLWLCEGTLHLTNSSSTRAVHGSLTGGPASIVAIRVRSSGSNTFDAGSLGVIAL